jgi:hypothetical protein
MIYLRGNPAIGEKDKTYHHINAHYFDEEILISKEHADLPEYAELDEVFAARDPEEGYDELYQDFLEFVQANKTDLREVYALKHNPDEDPENPFNPHSFYFSEFLLKQLFRNLQLNAYETEDIEEMARAIGKPLLINKKETYWTKLQYMIFMYEFAFHPNIALKQAIVKYGPAYHAIYLPLVKAHRKLKLYLLSKKDPDRAKFQEGAQLAYDRAFNWWFDKFAANYADTSEQIVKAEKFKLALLELGKMKARKPRMGYGLVTMRKKKLRLDQLSREGLGPIRDFNLRSWLTEPLARAAILQNDVPTSLRQKFQYEKAKTLMEIWDSSMRYGLVAKRAKTGFIPLPPYTERSKFLGSMLQKYMWHTEYLLRLHPKYVNFQKVNRGRQRLWMLNKRLFFLTKQQRGRLYNNFEAFDNMYAILTKPFVGTNDDFSRLGTWSLDNVTFDPFLDRNKVPNSLHTLRYPQLTAVNLSGTVLLKLKSIDSKYNQNRRQIYEALEAIASHPEIFTAMKNEEMSSTNKNTYKIGEWQQLLLLAEENYYDDLQKKTIASFWCPIRKTFVPNMYPKPMVWFLLRYYSKIAEAIILNDKILALYYRRFLYEVTNTLAFGGPVNVSPRKEWPVQFHWIWKYLKKKYLKNVPYSFFGISSSATLAQKLENNEILPQFDSESLKIDNELAQEALIRHVHAYAANLLDDPDPKTETTRHFMHNGVPYYFRGTPIIDANEMHGTITPSKIPDAVREELIEQKVLASLVPTFNAPQPSKLNDMLGNIATPQYMRPLEFWNTFHIYNYAKYELCPPWSYPYVSNWFDPKTGKVNDFWYLKEIYEELGMSEVPTNFGFSFGHEIVHLTAFLVFSVSLIYIPLSKKPRIPKIIALISGIVLFFHVFPYWI